MQHQLLEELRSKVPAAGESTQGSDILTISLGGKSGIVELTEEVSFILYLEMAIN